MATDTKDTTKDTKAAPAAKAPEPKEAKAPEPEVRVNDPLLPEAIAEQHAAVDRELAERNEANLEGHEKNMRAIEQAAEQAAANTEVPLTGKENNRNTPTVLPDGTKVWN